MSLEVLVFHALTVGIPTLDWQIKPMVSDLPHTIINTGHVMGDPNTLTQADINAVDTFLLGKKFVDGALVAMTAQEAQDQLDAIEALAEPVPGQIMTPREFIAKIIPTTKDTIYVAAMTDPQVMQVKDDLIAASHIDLKDPDLAAGLSVLVAKGLMTEAEKSTLLTIVAP